MKITYNWGRLFFPHYSKFIKYPLVFPAQPQNNGFLLMGFNDKDAQDNPDHLSNTGKHQEGRKKLEINHNKCQGKTTKQRLLTLQLKSNNASCEILVTTYQIVWYTISRCSYELSDYSVTTHITRINIHHSQNIKSHKEWKGSLHAGTHLIFQMHYL